MKIKSIASLLMLTIAFTACKKNDDNKPSTIVVDDKFDASAQGWTGDFADYPSSADPAFYELSFGSATLPEPLDKTKKGLRITGNNHSDDLFMFIKKKVTGLKPNQVYKVKFEIELASNAASKSSGIGGAPGESVTLGAGFSLQEPKKVVDPESGLYRMNIKKTNQTQSGEDMAAIGNIGNGTDKFTYKLIQRSGEFKGKTDAKGEVWLIVGTDSGFEGLTALYYTNVKATFTASN
jgi:hypothetical protein